MTFGPPEPAHTWTVFKGGSSSNYGNNASMILEDDVSLMVIFSLLLEFSATNNQVEYEAVIVKLTWQQRWGKRTLNSGQIPNYFFSSQRGVQTKDPFLRWYLMLSKEKLEIFKTSKAEHVPKEQNILGDVLSKMASTMGYGQPFLHSRKPGESEHW